MTQLPTYTEVGFAPATLGGMAIHLQTNQGFFYVFGIDGNLENIQFDYSPDGERVYDEINYTKSYEVDIRFDDGTYDRLKPHVQQTVKELGINDKAHGLYVAWCKEMDAPVIADPDDDMRRIKEMNISPELQKKLLALWGIEDEN